MTTKSHNPGTAEKYARRGVHIKGEVTEKKPILKTRGNTITVTNPYSGKTFKVSKEDRGLVEDTIWCVSKDYNDNRISVLRGVGKGVRRHGQRLSRLIMKAKPHEIVLFKNGDTTDLRRCNMRCTSKKTGIGQKMPSHNKSGFKGVCWNKQRRLWTAQIMVNRKMIYFGGYTDILEAADVYNKAALKYHGEFARLNDLTKPGRVLAMP
ncbi:hypothetical protein R80B4_01846 [Fibrobacteres bacterium R8-0-B4]